MKFDNIKTQYINPGLVAVLQVKINNLDAAIDGGGRTGIEAALGEYYQARNVAGSFGVSCDIFDDYLIERGKELRDRFGIMLK